MTRREMESVEDEDGVRGLTSALAEDLGEDPERIEWEAADLDIENPWDADRE